MATVIDYVETTLRMLSRRPTPEQAAEIERIRAALQPLRDQVENERANHDDTQPAVEQPAPVHPAG